METKSYLEVTNEWLELKKMSVKYPTYIKYESIINTHIKTYFKDYSIDGINDDVILNYFNMLFAKGKYANSTLLNIRFILKSIDHYIKVKYNTKGCCFELIKINKQSGKVTTLTEYQKTSLSNYCFNHYEPIAISVLIALYGGLRIGEICALKWENIKLDEGCIYVDKTVERLKSKQDVSSKTSLMLLEPKTFSSKRVVPIPSFLLTYIKNYQENNPINNTDNFVLTNSNKIPDPRTNQYRFRKLCKQFDFSINFHSLRHSYATNCVMQEIDTKSLSEILGHSNVGITLNLYVHSSLDFKKIQVNKIMKL